MHQSGQQLSRYVSFLTAASLCADISSGEYIMDSLFHGMTNGDRVLTILALKDIMRFQILIYQIKEDKRPAN
jgi:hypothetical protein